jgi:hypothetical protein
MKKYSLEFKLLLVFISVELILFLLSFTEIFNLLHSLTISLFTCLALTIYFIIRREKIPINLSLKLSRIVFITFFGALFLLNVFVITGGMSKITVPFFITGMAVIIFTDLESLGIVKTFYGQKISDLDDLEIKNKFLHLIMIISIIWPLIPLPVPFRYSRFHENLRIFEKLEIPFVESLMAVADSDVILHSLRLLLSFQIYIKTDFLYGFGYGTPGISD